MTKKDFITKVRAMKNPDLIEMDDEGFSQGTCTTYWIVCEKGESVVKGWSTPSVKETSERMFSKEAVNPLQVRVEKARKKYQRWFKEATTGEKKMNKIVCSELGCKIHTESKGFSETLDHLKNLGWDRIDNMYFCPKCAKLVRDRTRTSKKMMIDLTKYAWTSEKPTEPGDYYYKYKSGPARVVTLIKVNGKLAIEAYDPLTRKYWCAVLVFKEDRLWAKIPSPDELREFEKQVREDERKKYLKMLQDNGIIKKGAVRSTY